MAKEILVSCEDAWLLTKYRWYISEHGYVRRTTNDKTYLHRLIMSAVKGQKVDHINGNKLDNTRENLRIASAQENSRNRKPSPRGANPKLKGVSKSQCGTKWVAYIGHNRRKISLGTFTSEQDAAKAYNVAALRYFGEFCKLNPV